MKILRRYAANLLLGIDQLGNTILGGAPDETISARTGRNRTKRGWRVLEWALNRLDRHHTAEAICSERLGTQQDAAYRDVYDEDDAPTCGQGR